MVSLWGSKNGDERDQDDSETPQDAEQGEAGNYSRPQRSQREADERTRLIPPHPSGFLDPDDPAVRTMGTPEPVAESTRLTSIPR